MSQSRATPSHLDNVSITDTTPPSPHSSNRDSRRVSIHSLDSNASNSTIKYHNPSSEATSSHPHQSGSQGGQGGQGSQRVVSSSGSYLGTPKLRPRASFRQSNTMPNVDPSSGESRHRRPSSRGQGRRPSGSGRSSIREQYRSDNEDDDDDDDEDEDDDDMDERYDSVHHGAEADDYFADARSNHSRLRPSLSRRSTRILTPHDRRSGDDHDQENDESDVEPLTLKDRQETLNQSHPFGLPLWKPALYKKSRSVIRKANSALHSQPSAELYLSIGNVLWTLLFGWWLALVCFLISLVLYLTPFGGRAYGRVVMGLSYYLLWPFGQYVERELAPGEDSLYHATLPNGNGSATTQHGSASDETRPLLSRSSSTLDRERKANRKKLWTRIKGLPSHIYHLGLGGIVYYIFYYTLIGPLHMLVSCLCWFMVVSIPMGKFTYVIASHLHQHPLRLSFKRGSSLGMSSQRSEILLCTYDAIGFQYYKYTYDGTNIIFINLMPIVFFTILDDYVLTQMLGHGTFITSPAVIFSLGLASVIPLSYFIGMAVSSISAQSSLGMGAVINATFGSIIEIILYTVALTQGKGLITEGALIGSFLAGLLLMPGVSMMSGALKKKEQKFNAKSAGVTATMLIMALIGVLTPTLFYSIYGRVRTGRRIDIDVYFQVAMDIDNIASHFIYFFLSLFKFELRCTPCPESAMLPNETSCQRCYHHQPNPADDVFFQLNVKPLMYFCCIILPSAYLIGIWFSLRTHVKQIWHEPQHPSGHDSSIYRKLIPSHIVQQLLHYGSGNPTPAVNSASSANGVQDEETGHAGGYQNAGEGVGTHDRTGSTADTGVSGLHPVAHGLLSSLAEQDSIKNANVDEEEEAHAGHDSPNWSKGKSATVLFGCTLLYAVIAEILVDSVDAVSSIDEKLLGLTLFALVPNVTEFMNAISFAMYGNIALSMEIGSAYALQVCLIQIPAMVAVSAWLNQDGALSWKYAFNLVFPRWDVFAMLFSVFLLTYTYIEGKSNYFKGSILILSYFVLMAGFFWAPASPGNGDVSYLGMY
ncbi:hypothetical protein BGZ94_007270 [Podila epigama]|nr:hypothetical protein BGZ94_007270 [Podila epigama]